MDVTEHPLDEPMERFADALEEWLGKWGRRITQLAWKEYQQRPRGLRSLGIAILMAYGRKQAEFLADEELWQQILDDGYGVAFPFVNEAAYAGFAAGEEMLLNIGAVIDFDLVNPHITGIGIDNTMLAVSRVNDRTRRQLRDMMSRFYAAPEMAKTDFITALEPLFGRTRAEMIAVTEMTNAYAAASIETARQAPIEVMYEVSTANDPDVCTICTEAEIDGPYPLDDTDHRPALHPRCRCDVIIVERPVEERAPTAVEKIPFHGSKEDKAFWTNQASKLPDQHIETLRGVYAIDDKAWLAGKPIPMTAYQGRDAAGIRLNSRIICYRGHWARDAHVVMHEMAHEAWTNVPGEALSKINGYFKRASTWNAANPGAWMAQQPKRFISRYSLVNSHEFFAEHYSAYVLQPRQMQKMSKGLYNLYRDQIFNGLEFL